MARTERHGRRRDVVRIAQLTSSLIAPLGGAEQYALALARRQRDDGHDVTIVTGWIDDRTRAELAAEGLRVRVIPGRRPYPPDRHGSGLVQKLDFHLREILDSVRRTSVTRALERGRFDVVHVHRFSGYGTSVLRTRRTRVVHTVHDFGLVDTSASLVRDGRMPDGPSRAQAIRRRLIVRGIPRTTAMIFPSAATLQRHRAWGFDADAVESRVIPHGWPTPKAVARSPHDGIVYLFLGKLSELKGVPTLLRAWGDGVCGAQLLVGGDGELAEAVSCAPGVEALGWLDAEGRSRALAEADALVVPSEWPENFPIVVAEAVLAGVPVISTGDRVAAPRGRRGERSPRGGGSGCTPRGPRPIRR